MAEITKLTPEQEELKVKWIEKYRGYGMCTDPADFDRAENALKQLYKKSNLSLPIMVRTNPYTAQVLINEASHLDKIPSFFKKIKTDTYECFTMPEDYVRKNKQSRLVDTWIYGQWDAPRVCFLGFVHYNVEAYYNKEQVEILSCWDDLTQSCGRVYAFENYCFVCDRPSELRLDPAGRLHAEHGPAVQFRDGFQLWRYHGVKIPSWVITNPERITANDIAKENNEEIKAALIEIFGGERFCKEFGAVRIHTDEFGSLWQKKNGKSEDMLFVELLNSTVEDDGRVKKYFLQVHPELRPMKLDPDGTVTFGEPQKLTAHNAVASTYNKRGEQYYPLIET